MAFQTERSVGDGIDSRNLAVLLVIGLGATGTVTSRPNPRATADARRPCRPAPPPLIVGRQSSRRRRRHRASGRASRHGVRRPKSPSRSPWPRQIQEQRGPRCPWRRPLGGNAERSGRKRQIHGSRYTQKLLEGGPGR
jgi:hypothetical protein